MCSREHLNMGSPYIPYSQRYWEAQFLLMTNWVRHTDIAEHLCLCQFSLWSIAEFAKFFPFVTLHLAGPHVLFHASIWWVPSWPRGGMHYLCFIPPRIPTFCLCSSRYKIHSCCTIGEPLCHWDFYGSIPKKKKHRNWTRGLAGLRKYSLLMPQPNTDCGVLNNFTQSALSDSHQYEWPPWK